MTLTKAQKRALKNIKTMVALEGNMEGGHAYNFNGNTKIADRRTLVVLEREGLIEWEYDHGFQDHELVLTEEGEEVFEEKNLG